MKNFTGSSFENEPKDLSDEEGFTHEEIKRHMEIIKDKNLQIGENYELHSPYLAAPGTIVKIHNITEEGLIQIISPRGELWSTSPESFTEIPEGEK